MVCLPRWKWHRPLVSPPDAPILRQLKTVMCSSDVKWERGQVNHSEGNKGWERWVVVRGRLDPTATFLLLADKNTHIRAHLSPHFFVLCISFFILSSTSLCLCLCHATMGGVWAPQPPRGAMRECQIHHIHLCELVCLCGIRPCGSFKPLLEKHGCSEVNGKLKQNVPACCAAYSL